MVEFETLWHLAWEQSIDSCKAGLHATLLIRHPTSGRLIVNFDKEILLLIRETKCLLRLKARVPEGARLIVMQEVKFKAFYNQLSDGLKLYEQVLGRIPPLLQPLLKPHVLDVEARLQPGMTTLQWTSMNIDAFLHSMYAGVSGLEELTEKVKDLVDNRIERNLKAVSNMNLVELPADDSYSVDKFVAVQEKHVQSHADVISGKNLEVENYLIEINIQRRMFADNLSVEYDRSRGCN